FHVTGVQTCALPIFDAKGDAANGSYVGGDIIAPNTVAPRYAACQPSIFIRQADRHAVELQFAEVFVGFAFKRALNTSVKFFQLLPAVGVSQREHRIAMVDRGKLFGDGSPDALRGRIGALELRELFLQRDKA